MATKAELLKGFAEALSAGATKPRQPNSPQQKRSPVRTKSGKPSDNPGKRGGLLAGKRRGGRKKGTPNKATALFEQRMNDAQEFAGQTLSHDAIEVATPLEIILHAMRACCHMGLLFKACDFASIALPFTSARLSTVVQKNVSLDDEDLNKLSDQELHERLAEISRQMRAGRKDDDDGSPPGSKLQ